MAGGMRRRDDRTRLEDRVAAGDSTWTGCPMRHVWVADPVDGAGVKRPGLLVEWRRDVRGVRWEGLVHYAAELRPGRWAVVEEWVAADLLTQA